MRIATLILGLALAATSWAQSHPGRQDIAPSGTLPIVHINTVDNTIIDQKETYIAASLWIDASMCDEYTSLGSESAPVTLGIRGRGHSSWTQFDKKPYKIKFDKKQEVLGMPKSKHYALLAHTGDVVNTADAVGYKFAELLCDEWNPRFRMVEVALNGYNIGLYWLCESVRIEPTRINIFEQPDMNEDPATVHGGWIMEIDNYEESNSFTVPTASPRHVHMYFTPKSPELLSPLQQQWIYDELSTIDKAITASHPYSTEWCEHLDLTATAQYIAAQEIICNLDAFRGNAYMHRDLEGKWRFGSIWDIDWNLPTDDCKGWTWEIRERIQPSENVLAWLPELMSFRNLQEELKLQFAKANSHLDEVMQYAGDFHDSLAGAIAVDAQIWPQYHGNGYSGTWVGYIKPRLQRRMQWLTSPGIFDEINSSIDDIDAGSNQVIKSEYYDLTGRRIAKPTAHQLCIRRDTMNDGTLRFTKTVTQY